MTKTTSLLQIGDCVLLPGDERHYYGLILWQITQTVESETYSFLLCGRPFEALPSLDTLLATGLLGRRIPMHASVEELQDGSYLAKGKFSPGLDTIDVMAVDLVKICKEITVIGNIRFSAASPPSIGSLNIVDSTEHIIETIISYQEMIGAAYDDNPHLVQEVIPTTAVLGT